jgi:ubiquinone/menaquinone biosynthesis C-methylase UbiE
MITGGYLFFKEHFHVLQECLLLGVRKIIKNLISANTFILDVGCGTGVLVFFLSDLAKKVIGVDKNKQILEYAQRKKSKWQIINVEFVSKDANDLKLFSEICFDYVIFSMFLHQFSTIEAHRVLDLVKKNAKYIILLILYILYLKI